MVIWPLPVNVTFWMLFQRYRNASLEVPFWCVILGPGCERFQPRQDSVRPLLTWVVDPDSEHCLAHIGRVRWVRESVNGDSSWTGGTC